MNNNEIINFYLIKNVKNKAQKYENPNFKLCQIKHPFRTTVIAPSGTGKSNFTLNLLYRMSDTFYNVILCCKTSQEPLYQFLTEQLGERIRVITELNKFPTIDDLKKESNNQTLIIFDDMVTEKNCKPILDMYMLGRKLNCSMMFLTQSYFKCPKFIRQQCNYIILYY